MLMPPELAQRCLETPPADAPRHHWSERIQRICSLANFPVVTHDTAASLEGYSVVDWADGYEVVTDRHVYRLLIDNTQQCCEDTGYCHSEDRWEEFLGAELQQVRLSTTALQTLHVETIAPEGFACGGIQFVDFVTDRGVFQVAVYNEHTGYYGHSIWLLRDELVLLQQEL